MRHIYAYILTCFFRCAFKLPFSLNFFAQPLYTHTNGFSPVWIMLCTFSRVLRLNAESHSAHLNGRKFECRCMWSFNWPFVLNRIVHPACVHGKGRSPV